MSSQSQLQDAVIVAYGRSAVAKSGKKGALRMEHPVTYAGEVLKGVLDKLPELDRNEIEDVIVGCAKPEGPQGGNVARMIALRAGLSHKVSGQTVNRFCSSGLQAISTAANMIMTGQAAVMAAGGVESMTAMPMGQNPTIREDWLAEHEPDVYLPMGVTAENVAEKYHVSREAMDALAVVSHEKAAKAQDEGKFAGEIIPLPGVDADGNPMLFAEDQGIRRGTSMESLATLKTVFKEEGGVVTAGQSSQTSDGAGFVIMMSRSRAEQLGIKPLARFVGFAVDGVDPAYMGMGPVAAVPKVMRITGLSLDEMDLIEINEAFAAQAIPCCEILGLNMDIVNVNGGALALGHPLGATGAILTCKILSELERRQGRYGLVTMCIGGGMGAAGIVERLE